MASGIDHIIASAQDTDVPVFMNGASVSGINPFTKSFQVSPVKPLLVVPKMSKASRRKRHRQNNIARLASAHFLAPVVYYFDIIAWHKSSGRARLDTDQW